MFVFTSEKLDKANYPIIRKLFGQLICLLWPEGICHDDVLLFETDAAPYMIKAAYLLKVLYLKMAHAHHRIAETIRRKFNNVRGLVSGRGDLPLTRDFHRGPVYELKD